MQKKTLNKHIRIKKCILVYRENELMLPKALIAMALCNMAYPEHATS